MAKALSFAGLDRFIAKLRKGERRAFLFQVKEKLLVFGERKKRDDLVRRSIDRLAVEVKVQSQHDASKMVHV